MKKKRRKKANIKYQADLLIIEEHLPLIAALHYCGISAHKMGREKIDFSRSSLFSFHKALNLKIMESLGEWEEH